MQLRPLLLAVVLLSAGILPAEDSQSDDQKQMDQKLAAFANVAILQDRGLTCTPFAGSSDRWILERLLGNERFMAGLRASEPTSDYVDEEAMKAWPKLTDKKAHGMLPCLTDDGARDDLAKKLTAEEMEKLPGVYLRLEGFMALSRPEFAELFEDRTTQEQITKTVTNTFHEKAGPIHRTFFSFPIDEELMPLYHGELRKVSAELDLKILMMLSETEQVRLRNLLTKSKSLNRVVQAPPPK